MTPSERRTALIRLLADIDQQISLAEDLAFIPMLTRGEREYAIQQLEFRRKAVMHVEGLLAKAEG
jgi:hypothetical protein